MHLAQPEQVRFPVTTALLEQAIRDRVFPGCAFSVLVAEEGRPPLQAVQAVGRFTYDPDSPQVSPATIFDLASLTKVLATTAAAMLLYDRKLLLLDAPVAEWLPEFLAASGDTRKAQVTVRMLLDHSSGIPGYVRLFESARDREATIAAALHQPLTADPGTRAEYSDIGFIVLGHLIETVTGEHLDSFCRREIFGPLGMNLTGYCPDATLRPSIPPTEDDRSFRHRIVQGEVHDENASVMGGVAGHAGLFSDALDPLRFAACVLAGGLAASGQRLFAEQTIAHFSEVSKQPPGTSRALGWDTPSTPSSSGSFFSRHSVGHLGFTGTSLWLDLDARLAIVLLTNRTWPDRSSQAIRTLRPRFHDALRQELAAVHKK